MKLLKKLWDKLTLANLWTFESNLRVHGAEFALAKAREQLLLTASEYKQLELLAVSFTTSPQLNSN